MEDSSAISPSDDRMFRALVLMSGHDRADFKIEICPDEHLLVHGPHGTATYSGGGWVSIFGRQLYQGLFDQVTS
jgi:hypothetical protein